MRIEGKIAIVPSEEQVSAKVSNSEPSPSDYGLGVRVIGTGSTALTIQYDDAGSSVTYIGKAAPGSATSSALWQIMKLDEASSPDFSLKWADGNGNFDNIWDNRSSLTYS
jgi:hypothetical protein